MRSFAPLLAKEGLGEVNNRLKRRLNRKKSNETV